MGSTNLDNEIVSHAHDDPAEACPMLGKDDIQTVDGDEEMVVSEVTLPQFQDLHGPVGKNTGFLASDLSSPLLDDQDKHHRILQLLDYLTYLLHLAVFGILGVLSRHYLKKLFKQIFSMESNGAPLHPDILANMVGCFLMGWFGVVFKEDVSYVSDHIAVGITTGYMGSLTTFSGWNQKMVEFSSQGLWGYTVFGIIIGICAVDRSIDIGVWTAEHLKSSLIITPYNWKMDIPRCRFVITILTSLALVCLLGTSGVLAKTHLDEASSSAELWLGLLVAPVGVWSRWFLARFNGRGLGKSGNLRWLPVGTLMANLLAACFMASISAVSEVVNTQKCGIIVGAIQLGYMGSLSTVSTFAVELHAMRRKEHEGRALAYVLATFATSLAMGTFFYFVPPWTKHYWISSQL